MTVTGPVSETVKLSRPFAQINIATAGQISAGTTVKDLDFTGATSTVTVKNVPTVFSPLKGSLSTKSTVTFQDAAAPDGEIVVHDISYKHLAVNYVFAPVDGTVYDVTAVLSVEGKSIDMSVPSAPAKQNWKTNIVGDLLTTGADFNIVVTPYFEGDLNFDPENIKTKTELESVLTSYKSATIKNVIQFDSFVSSKDNNTLNIESTGAIVPASDMRPELSEVLFVGKNKLTLEGSGKIVGPSNSTYGNGSQAILVQGGNVEINGNLSIEGGSGSVANRAMKITNGTAIINGGYFHSGLDKNGNSSELIFLNPAFRKTAKLYIHGGTFETEGDASHLINMYDNSRSSCTVEIYGGKFKGFDPANVNEGTITSFVPDGYKSTLVGEYYVVTKADVTPVADQAGLEAALSTISSTEPATISLPDGEYSLYNKTTAGENKTLTIEGNGADNTTFVVGETDSSKSGYGTDYSFKGSAVTFKNIKLTSLPGSYKGFAHTTDMYFENCVLEEEFAYMGQNKATFKNCTFIAKTKYNLQTYTAKEYVFDNCTFKGPGYFVYAYREETKEPYTVTFNNCKFVNTGSVTKKSAVALKPDSAVVGNTNGEQYYIYFNNTTTSGIDVDSITGSSLYNSELSEIKSVVYVNGTKVWENGAEVQ